jgi:hypothetical protein
MKKNHLIHLDQCNLSHSLLKLLNDLSIYYYFILCNSIEDVGGFFYLF